jgi:hypothetical protein
VVTNKEAAQSGMDILEIVENSCAFTCGALLSLVTCCEKIEACKDTCIIVAALGHCVVQSVDKFCPCVGPCISSCCMPCILCCDGKKPDGKKTEKEPEPKFDGMRSTNFVMNEEYSTHDTWKWCGSAQLNYDTESVHSLYIRLTEMSLRIPGSPVVKLKLGQFTLLIDRGSNDLETIDPTEGKTILSELKIPGIRVDNYKPEIKIRRSTASFNPIFGKEIFEAVVNGGDVKALLERYKGMNMLDTYKNDKGDTAMIAAARGNNVHAVKMLLEAGWKVDFIDDYNNWTPLIYACKLGYEELASVLIAAGANVNVLNGKPMSVAVESGHVKVVELLSSVGAK